MKQFAVIGLSNFGYNLAIALAEKGNQVIAVDVDKELIQSIKDKVTVAVYADVKDKPTLKKLIDKNIDVAIVSLGQDMESSIMATLYLKEFGLKNIYVKSNTPDQAKVLELIGATKIIFPEKDMALKLASSLSNPNFVDFLPLSKGYGIIEINAPAMFHNKSLIELDLRNKYMIQVIAIKNKSKDSINLVPAADYKIKPDDTLVVAGKYDNINTLQEMS